MKLTSVIKWLKHRFLEFRVGILESFAEENRTLHIVSLILPSTWVFAAISLHPLIAVPYIFISAGILVLTISGLGREILRYFPDEYK